MDIQAWLQELPKAEHHLHLEGTIPWHMVREASDEVHPEHPEWLNEGFRFEDFTDFEKVIGLGIQKVITKLDAYHWIAKHHFQQLAKQNVRYVETSFGLNIAANHKFPFSDVVKAIVSAAPENMTVCVFGAFHRGDILSDELVQDALNIPNLVGIDLHGDERTKTNFDRLIEIYEEARRLGLRTKAHAGELRDSSSVREILDHLRPQRIQHGVRAATDKNMLARLAEQGIVLDMCPTSNLRLQVVPNLQSYPIRTFLEHGIEVTINTDDPSIFDCTVTGELSAMLEHQLLNPLEIAHLQSQAFARAELDIEQKKSIQAEIVNSIAKFNA